MSGRHWTPYELEIILHHAHSLAPFDRARAPLYAPTIQNLIERGYLVRLKEVERPEYSDIRPTEKCKVFVELLLATPEPRNVWLDPRDNKEIMPERPHPTLHRTIEATKGGLDWLDPDGPGKAL